LRKFWKVSRRQKGSSFTRIAFRRFRKFSLSAARTATQTVVHDVALWEELSLAIAGDVFAVLS
jgi:hypothetical protein